MTFRFLPKAALELPGKVRLRPEEAIQVEIVRGLRQLAMEGRPVAWLHVANELELGRRSGHAVAIRRRMLGVVPGAPDLIVFLPAVVLAIEVKTPDGSLSPRQRDFATWLAPLPSVTWMEARDAGAALAIVRSLLPNKKHTMTDEEGCHEAGGEIGRAEPGMAQSDGAGAGGCGPAGCRESGDGLSPAAGMVRGAPRARALRGRVPAAHRS